MDAPKVGSRGVYRSPTNGCIGFTVKAIEGNLCWAEYDHQPGASLFIWRFADGYNTLHDWGDRVAGQPQE